MTPDEIDGVIRRCEMLADLEYDHPLNSQEAREFGTKVLIVIEQLRAEKKKLREDLLDALPGDQDW